MKRYIVIGLALVVVALIVNSLLPFISPLLRRKPPRIVSAWISEPGQELALASIKNHGQQLSSICPMWYKIDEQGNFIRFWSGDPGIPKEARDKNVLLIPTIVNEFDPNRAALILRDSQKSTLLIDKIVNLVKKEEYDGIDLDFENLFPEDRDAYTRFVTKLQRRLSAQGALLSVTVQPKTSASRNWPGLRAQDYKALGRVADQVRVMAYDEHFSSSEPGPVASIDWVRDVVRYASKRVSKKKLVLGIPLYGYDWGSGDNAEAVDYASAKKIARTHNARVRWSLKNAAPYFTYNEDGQDHTVWFENARSVAAKLDIGTSAKVSGFSFFRLGIEDPDVWRELDERAGPK